jgi:hypothetical protein
MVEHGERIARTETRLDGIVDDIREIKETLKGHVQKTDERLTKIENALSEARGGWRTIVWLGGISATIGAGFGAFMAKLSPLSRYIG